VSYLDKIKNLKLDDLRKDIILSDNFLIYSDKLIQVPYAPFDTINSNAKIIIVGITPGWTQLYNSYKYIIQSDEKNKELLLKKAKRTASFSGNMRIILTDWLDEIGIPDALDVQTSQDLFNNLDDNLLHTTSVLRYPVFINNENYSGHKPKILEHEYFLKVIENQFVPEISTMNDALIIPLGKSVNEAFNYIKSNKLFNMQNCLNNFPHPSPANGWRNKQFNQHKEDYIEIINNWKNSN